MVKKKIWDRMRDFDRRLGRAVLESLEAARALILYRASGAEIPSGSRLMPSMSCGTVSIFFCMIRSNSNDASTTLKRPTNYEGAGKEFMSSLLRLLQPGIMAAWNSNPECLLRLTGDFRRGTLNWPMDTVFGSVEPGRFQLDLSDFQTVDEVPFLSSRWLLKSNSSHLL